MKNITILLIVPLVVSCAGINKHSAVLDISMNKSTLEIKSDQYGSFGYSCNDFDKISKIGEYFSFANVGRFQSGLTLRNANIQTEKNNEIDIKSTKSIKEFMEVDIFSANWNNLNSASVIDKLKTVNFSYDNTRIIDFYNSCLNSYKVTKEKNEQAEKDRIIAIEKRKQQVSSMIDTAIQQRWDTNVSNGGELELGNIMVFSKGSDVYYKFLKNPNVAYYINLADYVVSQPITDKIYFLTHRVSNHIETFPIIFSTRNTMFIGDSPKDHIVLFKGVINYKNAIGINKQAIALSE